MTPADGHGRDRRGVWIAVCVTRCTGRPSASTATSRTTKRWPLRSNSSSTTARTSTRVAVVDETELRHVRADVDPRAEDDVAHQDRRWRTAAASRGGRRPTRRRRAATPARRPGTCAPAPASKTSCSEPSTVPGRSDVRRRRRAMGGERGRRDRRTVGGGRRRRRPVPWRRPPPVGSRSVRSSRSSTVDGGDRRLVAVVDRRGEAGRDRPAGEPVQAPLPEPATG